LSVAERVGIRSDFSLSLRPDQLIDRWLWSRDFFSPDSFLSSAHVFEEGWDDEGCISLVFDGLESSFTVRYNFQEKDLCFLSLSSLGCRVSSFCMLAPSVLGSEFVRVCLRRCHCAPSILRGPDGKRIVAMPCVVTALT